MLRPTCDQSRDVAVAVKDHDHDHDHDAYDHHAVIHRLTHAT
jgi:hypothetical protein